MGDGSLDPRGLGTRELLADVCLDGFFSSVRETEDATDGGWVGVREVCAAVSGWADSDVLLVISCDLAMIAAVARGGTEPETRYQKPYQYLPCRVQGADWTRVMWRGSRNSCRSGGLQEATLLCRQQRVRALIGPSA